jgi:hypothetical protein
MRDYICRRIRIMAYRPGANVATTRDVYMQELPEGVRATVDSIHHELKGTMKNLAGKAKMRPPVAAATAAMLN